MMAFLNSVLNCPDHFAAANESTPMLKLRMATAAFSWSKFSNGKRGMSSMLSHRIAGWCDCVSTMTPLFYYGWDRIYRALIRQPGLPIHSGTPPERPLQIKGYYRL